MQHHVESPIWKWVEIGMLLLTFISLLIENQRMESTLDTLGRDRQAFVFGSDILFIVIVVLGMLMHMIVHGVFLEAGGTGYFSLGSEGKLLDFVNEARYRLKYGALAGA